MKDERDEEVDPRRIAASARLGLGSHVEAVRLSTRRRKDAKTQNGQGNVWYGNNFNALSFSHSTARHSSAPIPKNHRFGCVFAPLRLRVKSKLHSGGLLDGFGGQIHFRHVGLLAGVEHAADLAVLGFAVTPDNDAQIRIIYAQADQRLLQLGEADGLFVYPKLAAGFDGDVVGLAGRVFGMPRGGRKLEVQIVDERRRGDDKDNQQHEGEVEQRGDAQLAERVVNGM